MRTVTQKRKAFNTWTNSKEIPQRKKWGSKVMDGQYIWSMDRQLISEKDPFLWLSRGDLEGETESEIAAQGQALQSRCHMTELLQT